jgi:hypothetical protein
VVPTRSSRGFFGTAGDWRHLASHDGFATETVDGVRRLLGRIAGREVALEPDGARVRFIGPGFDLTLDPTDPAATVAGSADGEVDLTPLYILRWLDAAVFSASTVNYLNADRPGGAS